MLIYGLPSMLANGATWKEWYQSASSQLTPGNFVSVNNTLMLIGVVLLLTALPNSVALPIRTTIAATIARVRRIRSRDIPISSQRAARLESGEAVAVDFHGFEWTLNYRPRGLGGLYSGITTFIKLMTMHKIEISQVRLVFQGGMAILPKEKRGREPFRITKDKEIRMAFVLPDEIQRSDVGPNAWIEADYTDDSGLHPLKSGRLTVR